MYSVFLENVSEKFVLNGLKLDTFETILKRDFFPNSDCQHTYCHVDVQISVYCMSKLSKSTVVSDKENKQQISNPIMTLLLQTKR